MSPNKRQDPDGTANALTQGAAGGAAKLGTYKIGLASILEAILGSILNIKRY